LPCPLQAIDDTHSTLSSFTGLSGDISSIRSDILDKVNSTTADVTPTARTADKW